MNKEKLFPLKVTSILFSFRSSSTETSGDIKHRFKSISKEGQKMGTTMNPAKKCLDGRGKYLIAMSFEKERNFWFTLRRANLTQQN